MKAAARSRPTIRFRGRSFMALVLAPEAPFTEWLSELDDLIRRSPGFFVGRAVILDVTKSRLGKSDLVALIADLNAYHAFVTTLRQTQVTAYFTSLKMVGEIYLVEDPKDLGGLVRDAGRYEGTLSPDDLYELGASSSLCLSRLLRA